MNNEIIGLRLVAQHINLVQQYMLQSINNLAQRLVGHDQSKYTDDELDLLLGKSLLDSLEYYSDEYKIQLSKVQLALKHHYENNSHHPEYNGLNNMTLFDLIEMLCDSYAAGGDIENSLRINEERYNISPELKQILLNTAKELGWMNIQ